MLRFLTAGAAAVFLLAGCTDQLVTSPQESLFSKEGGGGDGEIKYEIIVLDGRAGRASDINDAGIIAGVFQPSSGFNQAAMWIVDAAGSVTGPSLLGALPEPFAHAGQYARSVNNSGVIVGYAQTSAGIYASFIYDSEQGMRLLPVVENTQHSAAEAISADGRVAGWISVNTEWNEAGNVVRRIQRGAVWLDTGAEPVLLPPLEGHQRSWAGNINNAGTVIGDSRSTSERTPVQWHVRADGSVDGPYALQVEGFYMPYSLNNQNDIAGFHEVADPAYDREATLVRDGTLIRLGFLPGRVDSEARGVSDRLEDGSVLVVGHSGFFTKDMRATVWRVGSDGTASAPVDLGLPSRHYESADAEALNVHGWIVGASTLKRGGQAATLWRPVQSGGGGGDDGGDKPCNPHPRTGVCR